MSLFRRLICSLFGAKPSSRKSRNASRSPLHGGSKARLPQVETLEDRFLPSSTTSDCLPTTNNNANQNCNTSNYLANLNTSSYLTNCNTASNQINCSTTNYQVNCNTTSSQTNCNTTSNQASCTTTTSQSSCSIISGYVYYDANNNGLMDNGEMPLANTPIELLNNANNTVIDTAVTDANGYYQFDKDETVGTSIQSVTKTLTFPAGQTDFSQSGLVDQFDPSLGTLVSVSITNAGSITSDIRVENTSTNSGAYITGHVAGNLTLTGPNGLSIQTNLSQYAGTVGVSAYDGQLDFAGSSGDDLGSKTANGAETLTLTGSALNAFIGTGSVQLHESAVATSNATGGGNELVGISSTACAQVNVVYNYIPSDCLKPGCYTIVKTADPAGYTAGKESSHGIVLNTPPGSNSIPVTLSHGSNSCNNDFGELKTSCLSGYVYADTSQNGFNDGIMQPDEAGISGVTITLTGTNAYGSVNLTTTTDGNGYYKFNNLQPGSYVLTETHPAGWVDGKDTPGSAGGMAGQDVLTNINLPAGTMATNNNFGEIQYSQLGGTVYYDGGVAAAFDNGVQNNGEPGIPGVTIQLSGVDFNGHQVQLTTTTDSNGHYLFSNLMPGTYSVTDVQPTAYVAGIDTVGSDGGQKFASGFTNVLVSPGDAAMNYNFGELLPSTISGYVYVDTSLNGYNDGIKEAGEQGIGSVAITLTGTNDQGAVVLQTNTDSTGAYSFAGLRPGTYTVTETPPLGYIDGKATLGGITTGQVGQDVLSNIALPPSTNDPNNNFGELSPSVRVFLTPPLDPGITPNTPTFTTPAIPVVSKGQLLSSTINNHSSIATQESAQFINSVYTSVLGRTVDSASLTTWLNYFQAGGTRQNFAAAIWNSAEHRANEVNSIYQAILGSSPSQATVNAYVGMFNAGASELAVAAAIAGSSQGTTLYPTTASFVNQLYEVAMGRTANPSEQATWAAFPGSRTALALAILTTPEALTDVVQQAYSQVLGRSASSNEVNAGMALLQSGGSGYTAFIDGIFASSEYASHMTV
jgi:hypothetical protein